MAHAIRGASTAFGWRLTPLSMTALDGEWFDGNGWTGELTAPAIAAALD